MPSSIPDGDAPAAPPPGFRFRNDTGEDLERLARLAFATAAMHCGECRDYHTMWPRLRSRGLTGAGPEHNQPLHVALLSRAAGERRDVRWLVAGSADAGLFALVARTAAAVPATRHAVTVVDRCETPLVLVRAHALAIGREVETVRGDLLEFRREASFDVVLMHQILKFFAAEDRVEVLGEARNWLAPGGALCLSVQDEPPEGRERRAAAKAWRAEMLRQDVRSGAFVPPEQEDILLERLRSMAGKRRTTAPIPLDGSIALVEAAGFQVEAVVPAPYEDPRLPALFEGSVRHLILARRP